MAPSGVGTNLAVGVVTLGAAANASAGGGGSGGGNLTAPDTLTSTPSGLIAGYAGGRLLSFWPMNVQLPFAGRSRTINATAWAQALPTPQYAAVLVLCNLPPAAQTLMRQW